MRMRIFGLRFEGFLLPIVGIDTSTRSLEYCQSRVFICFSVNSEIYFFIKVCPRLHKQKFKTARKENFLALLGYKNRARVYEKW